MGDIALGAVLIVGITALASTALAVVSVVLDDDPEAALQEVTLAPIWLVFFGGLIQQVTQGAWPWVVSRWKGLGMVSDWRLCFRWSDLWIGFATAMVAVGAASAVSALISWLVRLDEQSEASNTQLLEDAEKTIWLGPMIFLVVVGAPLTEELLFRGLILRAIEKRLGLVWAVIGSTLVFTLPHFTGSSLEGTVVLFGSIATVGAILGVVVARTGRLGPAIVAHAIFNTVGVIAALSVEATWLFT